MPRVRRRLACVAAVWLAWQVAVLVAVPTTLCAMMSASSLGVECTCAHNDGELCPMHHTRTKSAAASATGSCSCRSTSDPLAGMTASLLGPLAVVAAPPVAIVALAADGSVAVSPAAPLHWISVPDSPPPRS
jgi:hypothetical protein